MDDLLNLQRTLLCSITQTVKKIKEPLLPVSKQTEHRIHYLFLIEQLLNVHKQMDMILNDMKKRAEEHIVFLNT